MPENSEAKLTEGERETYLQLCFNGNAEEAIRYLEACGKPLSPEWKQKIIRQATEIKAYNLAHPSAPQKAKEKPSSWERNLLVCMLKLEDAVEAIQARGGLHPCPRTPYGVRTVPLWIFVDPWPTDKPLPAKSLPVLPAEIPCLPAEFRDRNLLKEAFRKGLITLAKTQDDEANVALTYDGRIVAMQEQGLDDFLGESATVQAMLVPPPAATPAPVTPDKTFAEQVAENLKGAAVQQASATVQTPPPPLADIDKTILAQLNGIAYSDAKLAKATNLPLPTVKRRIGPKSELRTTGRIKHKPNVGYYDTMHPPSNEP